MEGCIKPSHDRKVRLRPEIPKHPAIDVATKEELLRQKEHSRKNLRLRHQFEVATPNEDKAGRNINLRSRHETKTKGLYMEGFQVATKCKLKKQREVTTNHLGRNYI